MFRSGCPWLRFLLLDVLVLEAIEVLIYFVIERFSLVGDSIEASRPPRAGLSGERPRFPLAGLRIGEFAES